MQLKVRKIQQQQQPQGTVPSGSWDPQRQVDTSFPGCSSQPQYRDTMQGYRTLRRMWGLDCCQHLPQHCRSCQPEPEPVPEEARGGGMGPASLQDDSEPEEKEPKEEMESYRYLLQAGSQLESTLQREYTWCCWQSSFDFWEYNPAPALKLFYSSCTS